MSMKMLKQSPAFKEYTRHLEERLEDVRVSLEAEKDVPDIYRKQGMIAALRIILATPDFIEENARLDALSEEDANGHEYE